MRKFALVFILAGAMLLAACGGAASSTASTPTITMGASDFSPAKPSVTIKAGQSVVFNNPTASGATHILVTGSNGIYAANASAPSVFNTSTGMTFAAGDKQTITFPTAGTYTITCTVHPVMLATIIVQ